MQKFVQWIWATKMNFISVVCVCPCYHFILNELDNTDIMDNFNLKSPAHWALTHKIFYFLKNQNISRYLTAFVLKIWQLNRLSENLYLFQLCLSKESIFLHLLLSSAMKHLVWTCHTSVLFNKISNILLFLSSCSQPYPSVFPSAFLFIFCWLLPSVFLFFLYLLEKSPSIVLFL